MREASGLASDSELALGLRACAPLDMAAGVFSLSGTPLVLLVALAVALGANVGKNVLPLARAPKTCALSPSSSPPFISDWASGWCCDSSKRKRGQLYLLRYGGGGCRVASY